jgi:carboxyl-terminal processing protease
MIRQILFVLALFMCAGSISGNAQSTQPDKISASERAFMASKMYSSIELYFGHWQAVPDLDLDAVYQKYLDQAMATDDRRTFDLATLEFFAALQNGHSGFGDPWLTKEQGQPLGFMLTLTDGKWVVTRSRVAQLAVGDVVAQIDGQPMAAFYEQQHKYLAGSNENARRQRLFFSPFLFPSSFTLTLDDGRTVRIDRASQQLVPPAPAISEERLLEPNVAYLRIPSFLDLAQERKAVAFVKENAAVPNLIIDVRGNGGGVTPSELIWALMDRPYRDMTESTTVSVALFGAYGQVLKVVSPDQLKDRDRGSMESLGAYSRSVLSTPGALNLPDHPVFHGRVFILIDGECASACEDFVMPFKVSGRAQLIGQPTTGSTGQPYFYTFPNGMNFRVSSKRTSFPDGSQFEGVGITPELAIAPSIADLRGKTDLVLNKAVELARSK